MTALPFTIVHIGALGMNHFWGETERVRSATATCSLLRLGDVNLLVDPSPQPELLERELLATTGLRPQQIDLVFVTHHHGDHRYGLPLVTHAPWLMASDEIATWRAHAPEDGEQIARFCAAEGALPIEIALLPTPGHTLTHHSLAFDCAWGRVLVAGDAVMTYDHWLHDEGHTNSVDFALASETIRRAKSVYDWVIPGHGNYAPTGRGERPAAQP